MEELNASFIWLVTATPKTLRYSKKHYLSKVFKNIIPWAFNFLILKNDPKYLEKTIILKAPKRFTIKCLTPIELKIIENLIPKNILSMINAGNIENAVKALNCNVNTDDNILGFWSREKLLMLIKHGIIVFIEIQSCFCKWSIKTCNKRISVNLMYFKLI